MTDEWAGVLETQEAEAAASRAMAPATKAIGQGVVDAIGGMYRTIKAAEEGEPLYPKQALELGPGMLLPGFGRALGGLGAAGGKILKRADAQKFIRELHQAGKTDKQIAEALNERFAPILDEGDQITRAQAMHTRTRDKELGAFGAKEEHLTFGRKLGEHADMKTNFPDADFWIIRKGTPDKIGMPTKEFSPEHVGVRVRNHQIDPEYLYYATLNLHQQGAMRQFAKGTLALQHLTVGDLEKIALEPMMRGRFELGAAGGKTDKAISVQDVEKIIAELGLESRQKASAGGTTYVQVRDPKGSWNKGASVRVPSAEDPHGGFGRSWMIDTSATGTRDPLGSPSKANIAGELYEGNPDAVRERLGYMFGKEPPKPAAAPTPTPPDPNQLKLLSTGAAPVAAWDQVLEPTP